MGFHKFKCETPDQGEAEYGSFEVWEVTNVLGNQHIDEGFYWHSCFPGCLPDGDAVGPFPTYEAAVNDAQSY